jgi:hypothetical protein
LVLEIQLLLLVGIAIKRKKGFGVIYNVAAL